ncbi:hypothetical protein ABW20_dc0109153 [Dactylellina cionopaga]|nr:hypothetical protein ABW20_dc0109153 [Dactylellina cionopaga]
MVHNVVDYSHSMDQSNDSQRARAYTSYPMVPQSYSAAGSVGNAGPHHHSFHQQYQQQQHSHFDNMSFQNMQYSPSTQFAYNPHYPVMVPPSFPIHTVPNSEAAQYYHPQPFQQHPHFHPSGYFPSFSPSGYPSFVNQQPQPYNSQHLPSPVQSVATSVGSTGFSNSKSLSSPTTTVASTATKKMNRKSPVIASTPLKTYPYEEDSADIMSPTSTDFSGHAGPTNVYIKGLPATMTDRQLREMVTPFGEIISSKAIIDRPSGVCKGFGFAKFMALEGAEACIVDFTARNFEATIARDSFYSKLKDLADLESTNLYVSNLPPTWNEDKIVAIFPGYETTKCRLLVNQKGQSRGVAFVTFKDRSLCDEIIEKFNGIQLGERDHHLPLQVRYADTLAQKKLKKEKQEVGQFPKKSVMANHLQAMQRLSAGVADIGLSGSAPLLSQQGNHKVWKKSEALGHGLINAPPTPPQSVISAEEDIKSEKEASALEDTN